MPSKRRKDSLPAFDYREMLEITSTQQCQMVFISPETYQLCCSALRLAEYPTRWRNLTDLNDDPVNIETAIGLYHQAIKELTMSCDLADLTDKLERIAVALESIDTKTGEILQWDDMIDDIETTLGVGNAFVEILKWIGNLIPSLKTKVDVTPIIIGFWEYYTWKAPILALLTGLNASGAGIAAAQLAEKPLSLIRTVTSVFDSLLNLNNRIYEFILGDWNWYDEILKPIWEAFISDGEGGTGGDDPDNDKENRISVNINQQNIDNNTFSPTVNVSCSSCGGGGCSDCGVGSAPVVDPDPADGQPSPGYPDPENPPPGYPTDGTPAYDVYKCSAANYLFNAYRAYVDNHSNVAGIVTTYATSILSVMGANLFFAPFGPTITFLLGTISTGFLWAYLLTVLPGIVGLAALFAAYRDNLDDDRLDFICDLMNAQDVAAARAVIEAHIGDTMPVGLPSDWVEYHVTNLFTNNVLNILFTFYQPASEVPAENCTCGCTTFEPDPGGGVNPGTEILSETETVVEFAAIGTYTDRTRYDSGLFIDVTPELEVCGDGRTLTDLVLSSTPTTGAGATARLWIRHIDGSTTLHDSGSDFTPDLPLANVGFVFVVSDTPLTVTATFE